MNRTDSDPSLTYTGHFTPVDPEFEDPSLTIIAAHHPPLHLPRVQLHNEIGVVNMQTKFVDLRMKVLRKFMRINLKDFQRFLISLPVYYRSEQHSLFFDTAVLSSYMAFPELFRYLDYFWDYINYDLLEFVIRKFGDNELNKAMNSYCTQFAEVQSITTLRQLIILEHSHPNLQIVRPSGVFIEVVVRLEAKWDQYSLLDAERLRQMFIANFSLAPYSIAFCTAHEGTIVLKLWLRSECAPVIFHCKRQPVFDSRDAKLLHITVDGIPYQFHRSEVVNVEVGSFGFSLTVQCTYYGFLNSGTNNSST